MQVLGGKWNSPLSVDKRRNTSGNWGEAFDPFFKHLRRMENSNGVYVQYVVNGKFKNIKMKLKKGNKREKERNFHSLISKHFQCIYLLHYYGTTKSTFNRFSSFILSYLQWIYMIIESHYDKYQLDYFLLLFNFD